MGPYPSSHFYPYCRPHGRMRGKLLFLGVTLWLTSTVIAGVRRSTGWTHNAHGRQLSDRPSRADHRTPEWRDRFEQQLRETQDFMREQFERLEHKYGDSAADENTRREWRQRISDERENAERYWGHWARDQYYRERCGERRRGGLMGWYLGVGESTFDWVVRKISRSPSFHMQEPGAEPKGIEMAPQRPFERSPGGMWAHGLGPRPYMATPPGGPGGLMSQGVQVESPQQQPQQMQQPQQPQQPQQMQQPQQPQQPQQSQQPQQPQQQDPQNSNFNTRI